MYAWTAGIYSGIYSGIHESCISHQTIDSSCPSQMGAVCRLTCNDTNLSVCHLSSIDTKEIINNRSAPTSCNIISLT